MKAANWIDRLKVAKGWESDYRVAKELGLTRQSVSGYRAKAMTLDEDTSLKVAHALGINPLIVLTDQAMERAKNEEARTAWGTILERLGGVAAAAMRRTIRGFKSCGRMACFVKTGRFPGSWTFLSVSCHSFASARPMARYGVPGDLRLKSSHNAGCMRRSPASYCCHVRRLECTRAAAAV